MSGRPRTPANAAATAGRAAAAEPSQAGVIGTAQRRLAPALLAAGLAAAALATGSILGVVDGGRPGFTAWPVLLLLAALPAAAGAGLAARGRPSTAAGVLAGAAALAPGRAVVDLQFALDSSLTQRPELDIPGLVLAPPSWLGLGLVLAGHAGAMVAGGLALRETSALPDDATAPAGRRTGWLIAGVLAALALAVGLLLPPFTSADANLLSRSALDGPVLVTVGTVLIGLGALAAVVLALTEESWGLATGVLIGLAAAGAAVVLPPLAGAAQTPWLGLTPGPLIVLAAAAALLVIPRLGNREPGPRARGAGTPGGGPRQYWLYLAAGALAVLAAGCAIAGARSPLLRTVIGGTVVHTGTQNWLIPVGVVLGVLGVALLVPPAAAAARPAAAVAWVSVVLVGTAVLGPAVSGADLPGGVLSGGGAAYTALALVAAVLLAFFAAAAGVVERDDAEQEPVGPRLMWPAVLAAVLAVGAFVAPVAAPEGTGLARGVDVSFWGVLLALVVVLGALALAPVSRPARAIGTLAGVLCVLGVRLLEPAAAGGGYGTGAWFGFGCAAVVVVMIVLAARAAREGAGG